jgi:uncharacterized protein YeaO (DUF488 family)
MIYTSYFSSRKYKSDDGVAIARWCNFWSGPTFKALAPSEELLSWWKSLPLEERASSEARDFYEKLYRAQLSKLNPAEIATILDGKTLLCFERSDEFCHRHIVAKWLREASFECEEL